MEAALVSFGNYLLNKCKVKGYSIDGEPVTDRQVTDADLKNWKEEYKGEAYPPKQHTYLPSRFNLGEKVTIDLYDTGKIKDAEVIKIHFTKGKVLYDVEFGVTATLNGHEGMIGGRLYNLDSIFVKDND